MTDATIEQLFGWLLCWITSCIILVIVLFGGNPDG